MRSSGVKMRVQDKNGMYLSLHDIVWCDGEEYEIADMRHNGRLRLERISDGKQVKVYAREVEL